MPSAEPNRLFCSFRQRWRNYMAPLRTLLRRTTTRPNRSRYGGQGFITTLKVYVIVGESINYRGKASQLTNCSCRNTFLDCCSPPDFPNLDWNTKIQSLCNATWIDHRLFSIPVCVSRSISNVWSILSWSLLKSNFPGLNGTFP